MAPAQQLPTTNVVNLPRILPVLAIIFASVFLFLLIFFLLRVLISRRQSSARSPPRQLILPITVLGKKPKRLSPLSLLRASFAFSLARTSVDAVHDLPKRSTAEKLDMDFACRGLEHANGDDDDEDATLDALESGRAATTTPLSAPRRHPFVRLYLTTVQRAILLQTTVSAAIVAARTYLSPITKDEPTTPTLTITFSSCPNISSPRPHSVDSSLLSADRLPLPPTVTSDSSVSSSDSVPFPPQTPSATDLVVEAGMRAASGRRTLRRSRARIPARTQSLPFFPPTPSPAPVASERRPRAQSLPTEPSVGRPAPSFASIMSPVVPVRPDYSGGFVIDAQIRAALASRKRSHSVRVLPTYDASSLSYTPRPGWF